jgi:hypothetical protein
MKERRTLGSQQSKSEGGGEAGLASDCKHPGFGVAVCRSSSSIYIVKNDSE